MNSTWNGILDAWWVEGKLPEDVWCDKAGPTKCRGLTIHHVSFYPKPPSTQNFVDNTAHNASTHRRGQVQYYRTSVTARKMEADTMGQCLPTSRLLVRVGSCHIDTGVLRR